MSLHDGQSPLAPIPPIKAQSALPQSKAALCLLELYVVNTKPLQPCSGWSLGRLQFSRIYGCGKWLPAAKASPGSSLETPNLRPQPGPLKQNRHFYKIICSSQGLADSWNRKQGGVKITSFMFSFFFTKKKKPNERVYNISS